MGFTGSLEGSYGRENGLFAMTLKMKNFLSQPALSQARKDAPLPHSKRPKKQKYKFRTNLYPEEGETGKETEKNKTVCETQHIPFLQKSEIWSLI